MHSVQVYIDDELDSKFLNDVKLLMQGLPHDMLVEYEEHFNIPMLVMDKLHHKGLHPDIVSA